MHIYLFTDFRLLVGRTFYENVNNSILIFNATQHISCFFLICLAYVLKLKGDDNWYKNTESDLTFLRREECRS